MYGPKEESQWFQFIRVLNWVCEFGLLTDDDEASQGAPISTKIILYFINQLLTLLRR